MWYAVHTYTVSLYLSGSFLNFSMKELSTTGANFRSLYFRPLSFRQKILLWICRNFQWWVEQHSPECSEFPRIFEWFALRKFNNFRQIFWKRSPGNTIFPHLEFFGTFGWMERSLVCPNFSTNQTRAATSFCWFSKLLNQSNTCNFLTSFCWLSKFSTNQTRATFWHPTVGFPNFSTNQTRATFWHLSVGFLSSQPIKHVQRFDILLLVFQTFRLEFEPKTKHMETKKKTLKILYNTNLVALRSWRSIAAWFTSDSLVRLDRNGIWLRDTKQG